jgi:nucleoside-diphosphate-sugar epimerase
MRVFLTGGSGFVGRNLIRALKARGDTVFALARSDQAVRRIRRAGAEAMFGDLDDRDAMTHGMRGCDVIFHAAAHVRDWGPPELFHRVNVSGTQNALDAARSAGVKRFVHIGTEAIFVGGPPIVNIDETRALPEKPIGLYPLTKGLAEKLVRAANSPSLTTVVVRPRLIWGKGDSSVLPQIVKAVREGKFLWIDGGRYQTSTCHVRNVCEGAILAAEKGRGGEVYFLTDGEPVEFREFITALLETQGVPPPDRSIPRPVAYAIATAAEFVWRIMEFKTDPPITRSIVKIIGSEVTVNDTKARRLLGYRAHVTRPEGLAEMRAAHARAKARQAANAGD